MAARNTYRTEINIHKKGTVHQVGYLQGLYRDARSMKHKKKKLDTLRFMSSDNSTVCHHQWQKSTIKLNLLTCHSGWFFHGFPQCKHVNPSTSTYTIVYSTIQTNLQLNATISPVFYLTFIYSSTCFGRPHAHHQELSNCSSSLWFYRWSVVIAVLLVVVGPVDPTVTNSTAIITLWR
jgi:hypothetical protein